MFGWNWNRIDHEKTFDTSPFKASFNLTQTEKNKERNLQERRRSYIKERILQKEHLNSQIMHLEKQFSDKSLNEDTYARYKTLLEMNYEQEREAIREKHGFLGRHSD